MLTKKWKSAHRTPFVHPSEYHQIINKKCSAMAENVNSLRKIWISSKNGVKWPWIWPFFTLNRNFVFLFYYLLFGINTNDPLIAQSRPLFRIILSIVGGLGIKVWNFIIHRIQIKVWHGSHSLIQIRQQINFIKLKQLSMQ